jgi:hypothetical protein
MIDDDLETYLRAGLARELVDDSPVLDDLARRVRRRHRRRQGALGAALTAAVAVASVSLALAAPWRSGDDGRLVTGPVPTTGTSGSTEPTTPAATSHPPESITVEGTLVRGSRRTFLCLPGAILDAMIPNRHPGPVCTARVTLLGVPEAFYPEGPAAQWVRVHGRYDGTTIQVASIRRVEPPDVGIVTRPPCDPPPGGWVGARLDGDNIDWGPVSRYAFHHPGQVVTRMTVRPSPGVAVVVLASTDPRATRRALAGAYPGALCVVTARYTTGQLHAALDAVRSLWSTARTAGIYEFGPGITAGGQPEVTIGAVRWDEGLRQLVASQPAGLVRVDAWLPW